jgi:hypothetical protein
VTLLVTTAASLYKTRVHDVKNEQKAQDKEDTAADDPEESLDSR